MARTPFLESAARSFCGKQYQGDLVQQCLNATEDTVAGATPILDVARPIVIGLCHAWPSCPTQYDVMGDTRPSAVANSQWHTGVHTPIFIEDQPLHRVAGSAGSPMLAISKPLRLLRQRQQHADADERDGR
jgi:hypothetical protein